MEELLDAMLYCHRKYINAMLLHCYRKYWDVPDSEKSKKLSESEYYWGGFYFLRQRLLEELASRQ